MNDRNVEKSRVTGHGRLGEFANGSFGAVQFAETGFGWLAVFGKVIPTATVSEPDTQKHIDFRITSIMLYDIFGITVK